MEENRRPAHSVDDYYPNPSNFSDDGDDSSGATGEPEFEHTDSTEQEEGPSSYHYEDSFNTLTCPRCGSQVPGNMNFCGICGYHFPKSQETTYRLNDVRIDGYLVDDVAAFAGPNYGTYLRKFQKVNEGKISFNWAAAIFSNRWMAYRGMFRIAFLFSLVINIISGILSYIILMMFHSLGTQLTDAAYNNLSMFSMMITVAIGLVAGLIGDSLYWKHAKKAMDRLNCRYREAVSDLKLTRSLKAMGGCKLGYAMLIIVFDLSFNEMISYVLQYIISQA